MPISVGADSAQWIWSSIWKSCS